MNAEVAECCETHKVEYGRAHESFIEALRTTVQRFPSATKGALSIFDQALVSGTSFLTAAIVGRLTTPDQLGLYYMVLSIVLTVSGIQEQLIGGPFMVLSKRRRGDDLVTYGGSNWLYH